MKTSAVPDKRISVDLARDIAARVDRARFTRSSSEWNDGIDGIGKCSCLEWYGVKH